MHYDNVQIKIQPKQINTNKKKYFQLMNIKNCLFSYISIQQVRKRENTWSQFTLLTLWILSFSAYVQTFLGELKISKFKNYWIRRQIWWFKEAIAVLDFSIDISNSKTKFPRSMKKD